MRKTTISRSLLLTAALVMGIPSVSAQTAATSPVASVEDLTDGYYVIKTASNNGAFSGLVYYDLNDGANRRFRVDQDKQAYTDGTLEAAYIWKLTNNDDGTFSLMGMHDNAYIPADAGNNQNFRGTETANLQITVGEGDYAGKWYVTMTNYEHEGQATYWYVNQPGGDPNLSWWQNYTGNQAMQVEFYAMSGLPATTEVSYVLQYDGQQIESRTYDELFVGDALPQMPFSLPAYVEAEQPSGVVEAGATQYNIDCTLAANFPFTVSESYGAAVWHAVGLNTAPYYLHNTEGAESMALGQTEQAIDASSDEAFANQLWCVTGNPFDGFKLYNKAAGAGKILSSGNPTGADATTYPILVDETAVPDGNNTTWDITPSTSISGVNGFYIARHGEASNRMNLRDGKLAYWTDGADAGSTFRVLDVQDLYAANLDIFTRGCVGAPNADVIADNASTIDALAGGTGTPEQYVALKQAFDAAMQDGNTMALDAAKLYRIQNLARKASTGNTNNVGNGGFLEVTDKTVTEYIVDMAAIDGDPARVTALWQVQPIDGEDGHFRLYNPNAGVYVGSTVESGYLTTAASADEAGDLSLVSLGQAQYRLRNEQRNGPLHASGLNANNAAGIQIHAGELNSPSAWYLIPAETVSLTVGEAGYATLNLPVAVSLPEGLTAYTATDETQDAVVLTEVESRTLPAGSPVIVAGAAGTYQLALLPQNAAASLDGNGLRGTTMAETVADDVNAYILAMKEGDATAKFYRLSESIVTEVPYSRLVCVATTNERAGRVVELLNEGSTDLIGSQAGAQVNRLWSNATVDENDPYQLWAFEADPAGTGKYAMVCKAVPAGSVNPTPTAEDAAGRWDYDATAKHYNFTLTEVAGKGYTIKSDQVAGNWWMNFAGDGQGFSINLWSDPTSGDAGYFKPEVVETQEVVDNTPRVIAANKAYYVSNAAATAAFTLSFGGTTTGIDAVEAADGAEKATIYYDLSGRRVLYPSNGIFVTGEGQKVFIK